MGWHPYKIQICRYAISCVKEMWQKDGVQYSQWLLGKPQAFMSQKIIGDEAIFHLKGNVSNHNVDPYAPRGDPPEDFAYDKPHLEKSLLYGSG